jgi:NADH:ubiquinone oxidoreductase subunit 4 (subunit M)
MLSVIIFLPALGALLVGVLPRRAAKGVAVATTAVVLALTLVVAAGFTAGTPGFQRSEQFQWIAGAGISYHVGVDGVSLLLLVLNALPTCWRP